MHLLDRDFPSLFAGDVAQDGGELNQARSCLISFFPEEGGIRGEMVVEVIDIGWPGLSFPVAGGEGFPDGFDCQGPGILCD